MSLPSVVGDGRRNLVLAARAAGGAARGLVVAARAGRHVDSCW